MWVDTALILMVFLGLCLLGTGRLGAIIQIFAFQSFVLSLMPLLSHPSDIGVHHAGMALATLILKVFFIPYFLFWAIRHVAIRREMKPLIGYGTTLLLGGLFIAGTFLFSSSLELPLKTVSQLWVPSAFSMIAMGFLILISRGKAISQVIGYLVMENGIFLFALLLIEKMPLVVEMGILLDVFVGVFVMGIVVNHINEEFDHTNITRLTTLKD